MVRQRRSIAEMRCTVCGARTPADDRWWFRLGQALEGWALVTTEAPVHLRCAELARQVCPHLHWHGEPPSRFPAPDAVLSAIVGGTATENDFGIALGGGRVVGHLKFAWRRAPIGMSSSDAHPR
jgi:hypothetical protein